MKRLSEDNTLDLKNKGWALGVCEDVAVFQRVETFLSQTVPENELVTRVPPTL